MKSFTADIELKPGFREVPKVVSAKVSYAINGLGPQFKKVEVEDKPVPLSRVSLSSLLEAYQRLKPDPK